MSTARHRARNAAFAAQAREKTSCAREPTVDATVPTLEPNLPVMDRYATSELLAQSIASAPDWRETLPLRAVTAPVAPSVPVDDALRALIDGSGFAICTTGPAARFAGQPPGVERPPARHSIGAFRLRAKPQK